MLDENKLSISPEILFELIPKCQNIPRLRIRRSLLEWCDDNLSPGWKIYRSTYIIYFVNAEDMIHFKLRWL